MLLCSNTVIYLVAHKQRKIHMNNQEKFTTQSSKLRYTGQILKRYRRIPLDFPQIFSFPL